MKREENTNYIMKSDDREAWLEMRKSHLGASEIPMILGIHPYSSPKDVWESKKGIKPAEPENIFTEMGSYLEKGIIDILWNKYHKFYPSAVHNTWSVKHPDLNLIATPDAYLNEDGERVGVLQVKTTASYKTYKERVPEWVKYQILTEILVTNLEYGYIVACSAGNWGKPRIERVERDEGKFNEILRAVKMFWDCIKADDYQRYINFLNGELDGK